MYGVTLWQKLVSATGSKIPARMYQQKTLTVHPMLVQDIMTALGQRFAFDENKSKYFIKSNSCYSHCVIKGVVGGGGRGFELDILVISLPVCRT